MRIEAGRADVNALAVRAARKMSAELATARARAAGDIAPRPAPPDQLAVAQRSIGDRMVWTTMGSLPHGLEAIRVRGDRESARRNGWTIRELMVRRLHRAYCDALVAGRVCRPEEARTRARAAVVSIACIDQG